MRTARLNGTEDIPLPHSEEAEQGVLGSMLVAPSDAIPTAIEKASAEHFYVPAHRTVYGVLLEQWNAGQAIDLITFTQELRDRNLLDTVGGPPAITHLFTFVPTAANIDHYLDIVRKKKLRRDSILESQKTIAKALDESSDFAGEGSPTNELPPITDAAALVEQEKETPRDIVEGLLHIIGKLVFGGGSTSFKTWMLITLAVCVATASDFFGRRTTKGRVLFINLEIQPAFFARRIAKVCEALGLKVESLRGNLDTWNLRGFAADLSRMLPLLLSRIRSGEYCHAANEILGNRR